MKHLLTILLALYVFHISAQEIDYDFGNNGIADLDIAANSIHETGNGIILTDFSFSLAIDNDGIVRTQFGNNGTISSPFPSSGIDFISHSLILKERLVLLGCSRNVITQALDVYITHHDLETGEVFDGLTYTFSDTLDREYSAIYVDTDLHLFGYQNSQTSLFSLFHSTVDIETSEVVRDGSIEETGVAIPYIPFEFVNLSDGRILAIYTQDLSSPKGPRYFEVIEDVSEVRTESSLDLLPWVSDWDVAGGTVELNSNSILIVRNSKLAVLDIINQIEETIELDFVEDPFDVQSIQKYDEETFLVFGNVEVDSETDELRIYVVNNDYTLKKELGNDGIINKTYENLRSINSFKTEDYIYVSLDISSIESHLLRINSETNSTFDFVSNEILIYPIPASQEIFVKGNENKSFVSYQLHDMLGHKVQDGSLVDNKVTLQQHNPGLYFMSLRSNEELVTKQIVIE